MFYAIVVFMNVTSLARQLSGLYEVVLSSLNHVSLLQGGELTIVIFQGVVGLNS